MFESLRRMQTVNVKLPMALYEYVRERAKETGTTFSEALSLLAEDGFRARHKRSIFASKPPKLTSAELRRERRLQHNYDISIRDYDVMLEQQGGVCVTCGSAPDGARLSVDHDHETGFVRGLLCAGCNLALGNARDDEGRLRRLASYVEDARRRDPSRSRQLRG